MSSYVDAAGLGATLVNAKVIGQNKNILFSPLEIMKTCVEGILPEGQNADTVRYTYEAMLHDHDTYGNPPLPVVSKRQQISGNPAPLTLTSAVVDKQLGVYAEALVIDQPTMKIRGVPLVTNYGDLLTAAAGATAGKLCYKTFRGLPSGNTRFGNGVANEASVITKALLADYKIAYQYFLANNIPPITKVRDIRNNYNVKYIPACFVAFVHPDEVTDFPAVFTGSYEWRDITDYGGEGMQPEFEGEFGYCPLLRMRFVMSSFVEKVGDVATASTAGLKQSSGSTNLTYHNIVVGADAWGMPGLGKVVKAMKGYEVGSAGYKGPKVQGIDFTKFNPEASYADLVGLYGGLGYKLWAGDDSNNAGGVLLPMQTKDGSTVYAAWRVIHGAPA